MLPWWLGLVLIAWLGLRLAGIELLPRASTSEPIRSPSPWRSAEACREASARRSPSPDTAGTPLRLATWNLRWFPHGSPNPNEGLGTDLEWVACLVGWLRLDVVGLQEVKQNPAGRDAIADLTAALDRRTRGRWRAEFDDCPSDGRQHVGWLWNDARASLERVETLHALHPTGARCANQLRPGLSAYVRARSGADFSAIVLHLDSGVTERDATNRGRSLERLSAEVARLREASRDDDVVVLGDLNTMGCARCAPAITADDERVRRDTALATASLRALPVEPACTEYHRGRGALLDAIAPAQSMREAPERANSEGPCAETRCGPARDFATFFERVSDHCPVVVELGADDDR